MGSAVYANHNEHLSKKQLEERHEFRLKTYSEWEPKLVIRPGSSPRELIVEAEKLPRTITAEIKNSSIFSFLYYDGQQIKYDWKHKDVTESMPIYGFSMSKSITSYLLGKAFCDGRIGSLNDEIGEYAKELEGTFYGDVKLINALNMTSGDRRLYPSSKIRSDWNSYVIPIANDRASVQDTIRSLGNPKPSAKNFSYMNANTDSIASVVAAVSPKGFDEFASKALADDAGFKYPSYFLADPNGSPLGFAYFMAARTDWLRAAIKIGEDYHSHECIGDYLRSAKAKSVKTNQSKDNYSRYGKFFWSGRRHPKFQHLAMQGHGGIRGLIGLEQGRVITFHSIRNDFKERTIVKAALK